MLSHAEKSYCAHMYFSCSNPDYVMWRDQEPLLEDKFYDLRYIANWRYPPNQLRNIRCVQCLEQNNLCKGFIANIGHLVDCNKGCKKSKHCTDKHHCVDGKCEDPCLMPKIIIPTRLLIAKVIVYKGCAELSILK